MYCDTPQVNQLTALLIAHGIHDVVVCPGSRNSPLVHNLHAASHAFCLHPVTDERSAAFVALGICLATQEPAAVCVTSGSALLGCIPAVAEAYYRHLPLLVLSADRPPQWIGQLDGQTLPQAGALAPYCPTHALCIPQGGEDAWANNRRINDALLSLHRQGGGPAHINLPIAEPMFSFTTPQLPQERKVEEWLPTHLPQMPQALIDRIRQARLPALVVGQYERGDIRAETDALDAQGQLLVLPEVISDVSGSWRMNVLDALTEREADLLPDFVLQIGGNFVHKRFKQLLRRANCRVVRIGYDKELTDTFCRLETVVSCAVQPVLQQLAACLPHSHAGVETAQRRYAALRTEVQVPAADEKPDFGPVLYHLREQLRACPGSFSLHLGNSTAVRAAAKVFGAGQFPIYCNRGVNGIEGSLSAAVGYALKMWGLCIVVLGDLSFFYDANALWNTALPANLRILLLNNGHGGIFDKLPGLEASPARDRYIAAGGQDFSAQGIAETFHLGYASVHTSDRLPQALAQWLAPSGRAQLLEVFIP